MRIKYHNKIYRILPEESVTASAYGTGEALLYTNEQQHDVRIIKDVIWKGQQIKHDSIILTVEFNPLRTLQVKELLTKNDPDFLKQYSVSTYRTDPDLVDKILYEHYKLKKSDYVFTLFVPFGKLDLFYITLNELFDNAITPGQIQELKNYFNPWNRQLAGNSFFMESTSVEKARIAKEFHLAKDNFKPEVADFVTELLSKPASAETNQMIVKVLRRDKIEIKQRLIGSLRQA